MYSRGKKIDYCHRDLTNPFFGSRRKKEIHFDVNPLRTKTKVIIFAILFSAGACLWFFLLSPTFRIKKISINGLARVPAPEVEDYVWRQTKTNRFLFFPQKNLFVFAKNNFIEDLKSNYSFEKIEIKKTLPDTMVIDIQEKSLAYVWHENDKYYYSDLDGYLINEVSPLEIKQKQFPIISNQGLPKINASEEQGGLGRINIDNNYISYIIDLFNKFPEILKKETGESGLENLAIEKFITDQEINNVKLVLTSGTVIFFNTAEDKDKQLKKLEVIKDEMLKGDITTKTYIDLRFGDRIYYR